MYWAIYSVFPGKRNHNHDVKISKTHTEYDTTDVKGVNMNNTFEENQPKLLKAKVHSNNYSSKEIRLVYTECISIKLFSFDQIHLNFTFYTVVM